MLDPINAISADPAAIRRDLEYMTAHWHELPEPAMIEIRAFKEGSQPQVLKYAVDWMDDAVEAIVNMNRMGRNIYAVRNPVRASISGSASDADIVGARFLWADCDDPAAAGNVYRFDGPKWSAAVTTGNVPSVRVHTYWELSGWCYDLAAWRGMQTTIAAHFASDPTVVNPSRIMRVGGTVSWPSSQKQSRGYISELTTIRTEYEDTRAPVTIEQMLRVFGARVPAARPPSLSQQAQARLTGAMGGLQIDTGGAGPSLDRDATIDAILRGDNWHINMVAAVGSYVARGLKDHEIHAISDGWTLPGYAAQDTRREVQEAIDGARRKGWTPPPAPAYTPNFDHAPAPTASDPEPAAGGWVMQTAAEFTSDFVSPEYIVDGVVRRGMLYTLTAPTGSGKTAVMLLASTAIAQGQLLHDREVEQGDVIFMAGENPDDVRARMIATMEFNGIDPETCRVHFIAGTFNIKNDLAKIAEQAARLKNLVLIVVDTFAAYFPGDDENNNAQALDFARVVRKLTALPSKPAVVMPAHPVKNAAKSNLAPKGGSSLVNEVDGNLTLWNDGGIITLHWQVKFRGAEFEPLTFELKRCESEKLRDAKGRLMPTILAVPMLTMRKIEVAKGNLSDDEKVLFSIRDNTAMSLAERARDAGLAHKMAAKRAIDRLIDQKLVRPLGRIGHETTKDGDKVISIIENGGKLAPEI